MFDRFTGRARDAIGLAEQEADSRGHPHVGTEHLLVGLLAIGDGQAWSALTAAGATLEAARHKAGEAIGMKREARQGAPTFTPRATRALERASRFSFQRGDAQVNTGHVLLGVLDVEGTGCQVLRGLGVDVARLRIDVGRRAPSEEPAEPVAADIVVPSGVDPQCPGCGKALTETLAHRVMTSAGDEPRELVVAYCGACGSALGTTSGR